MNIQIEVNILAVVELSRKLEEPPKEVVKITTTVQARDNTEAFSEIYLGSSHIQDDSRQNYLDQGWALFFIEGHIRNSECL